KAGSLKASNRARVDGASTRRRHPQSRWQLDVSTSSSYCVHMDVGGRGAKEQLSRYLERVARGETIRVTDRGVPKAILAPLPGRARLEDGSSPGAKSRD